MKYERLTDRETAEMLKNTEGGSWDSDNEEAQRYIKLAEYEDLEEQGLLVRLPCKVGDKIFEVFNYPIPQIKETAVDKVVFTAKGIRLKLARNSFYETAVSSIGKTIFFTRAEAEKKLKELKGELK